MYRIPILRPGQSVESLYEELISMSNDELLKFEKEKVNALYPNSYTFAKSLTESLIQERYSRMKLPIVIVRPTCITPSISEPIQGWFDGVAGPSKVLHAMAIGEIQEWICDPAAKGRLCTRRLVFENNPHGRDCCQF
ncbi:hypothetical protein BGZ83_009687 [Gryganskiella cystojenkinii]|nr:hypothetical protein BGZ83_009687 [Gryganskiella cystojenkinii]